MKKTLLIALLILTGQLFANEFKASHFKYNPDSKIAVRYPRLDYNNQACALILIKTKIRNIVFEGDQAIIGNIQLRQGRYYLYVTASITTLKFSKDGFDVLEYKLPLALRSSNVYNLDLGALNPEIIGEIPVVDTLVKDISSKIPQVDSIQIPQIKKDGLSVPDTLVKDPTSKTPVVDSIQISAIKKEELPVSDTLVKEISSKISPADSTRISLIKKEELPEVDTLVKK